MTDELTITEIPPSKTLGDIIGIGGSCCKETDLDPGTQRNYKLPFGYEIVSEKGKYLIQEDESIFPVLIERIIELRRNGITVFTDEIPAEHDSPNLLYPHIKDCLITLEEPDKVDWIRRKFCGKNNEIPPWERTSPAREFNKIPLDEIIYSLNDDGNATRFEAEAKDYLINDREKGKRDEGLWYAWIDNHWEEAGDKLGKTERFIGQTIEEECKHWSRLYQKEQDKGLDGDKKHLKKLGTFITALMSHMAQSRNQGRQRAMLEMAAKSTMQINMDKNTDYGILAFKNGAIDCRTGEYYPIWKCDKLKTRYPLSYIDAEYTEGANPIEFKKHVMKIFYDNTTPGLTDEERWDKAHEIGEYFLRLLGYILIAGNPEELFVFWWGEGANGKSKTIEVLSDVLGNQHVDAPLKEISAGLEDKPTPKTALGLNKRLLTYSEASGGDGGKFKDGKISLADVKIISGERKTNRFRGFFKEGLDVIINCLPIGITNKLPRFDGELDYSALRRLITIPFLHKFEGAERNKDIVEELLKERDAIFSLMVDEMKKYLKEGLLPLPDTCKATQSELLAGYEYNLFVSRFEKTDGVKPEDRMNRETIKTLFMEWCDEHGIDIDTTMKLNGEDEYGNPKKKRVLTKGESNKLINAFRVNGINEANTMGVRYFKCRLNN